MPAHATTPAASRPGAGPFRLRPASSRLRPAGSQGSGGGSWPWLAWLLCLLTASSGCACLWGSKQTGEIAAARDLSTQGLDALQRGQWTEAEALFSRAVACCPVDERSRCHYAEMLWRRGAHDEALNQMREAVELSGENAALAVRLGEMYLERRQLPAAMRQAERAIALQAELPRAWALHGDVLVRQGKLDEALASYHRSLTYQEHFPRVQLAVAELYLRADRPERALGTLTALVDQYPPSEIPPEVLYQRGLALKELKRYQDAVQDLTEANRRGLASADLLYHLGESRMLDGDPVSAQLAVLEALELTPSHGGALQLREYLEARHPGMTAGLQR